MSPRRRQHGQISRCPSIGSFRDMTSSSLGDALLFTALTESSLKLRLAMMYLLLRWLVYPAFPPLYCYSINQLTCPEL